MNTESTKPKRTPKKASSAQLAASKKERDAYSRFSTITQPIQNGAVQETTLYIPMKVISEINRSGQHWAARYARAKQQKEQIAFAFLEHRPLGNSWSLPCVVTLTAILPKLMDSDNLQSAFKAVRDAVADQIIPGRRPGLADDDERITWCYDQRRGAIGQYAIEITFARITEQHREGKIQC